MKKIINITLGKHVFSIEDDAYEILSDYINSVKKHFVESEDDKEIIDDIEAGIAEKLNTDKAVITAEHVQQVIKEMGTVNEFDNFDEESITPTVTSHNSSKKLYRNPDDKVLAGVSSGLAAYLGISPVYIRLAFVIATFFWGLSILVYLVLWVVIPEAKTKTQKLSMQGERVSLATLKSASPADLESVRTTGIGFLNRLFDLLGIVFAKVISLIEYLLRLSLVIFRYVGGTALLIGSIACIAGITFVAIVLSFGIATPYLDPFLVDLLNDLGGYIKMMLLGFGYITAAIPLIISLILGVSILKKKNFFTLLLVTGLGVLWTISAIGFGVTMLKVIPVIEERIREVESRIEEKQSEFTDLQRFTNVSMHGSYIVKIEPGEETTVQATGAPDVLDRLIIKSEGGRLHVAQSPNNKICLFICSSRIVYLTITTPDINRVEIFGHSRGEIIGFDVDNMELSLHGGNRFFMDIEAEVLDLKTSGSARVALQGESSEFLADLDGISIIQAYSFISDKVSVEASGSSSIEVAPTTNLEANLSGSSILRYVGDNVDVDMNTTPSSHVRQVERDEIDNESVEEFLGFEVTSVESKN